MYEVWNAGVERLPFIQQALGREIMKDFCTRK